MQPETNVRDHEPSSGGTVVPLFAPCPECQRPIRTKKPATHCSPRCRASASRRRKVEAALLKLDAAEQGLLAALEVVRQLRGLLVFGGKP